MRFAAIPLAGLLALLLAGCASTLQDKPIPHGILEGMIVAPQTVYWLGGTFGGYAITEGSHDTGGAYALSYGDCLSGGQGICTPPLRVVTAPDNSFVPGGASSAVQRTIRGVGARVSEGGRTIAIPTGAVIVSIFAKDARTAAAAARSIVPINAIGSPGGPLPPPLPGTGYGSTPLPAQQPQVAAPLPES